jgi:hypothetical protein
MMDEDIPSPKGRLVKAKLSSIGFPELCPVCLDPAEDLVFITVIDKVGEDDYIGTTMSREDDKASIAMNAARGHATFAVPTCMAHGSKSVRSLRTRLVALVGFFVFFYPILYFLLQLNVALTYTRPVSSPFMGLVVSFLALLASLTYGLFPRALERKLKFIDVFRSKDQVILSISNQDYRDEFLDINGMNAEMITNDEA